MKNSIYFIEYLFILLIINLFKLIPTFFAKILAKLLVYPMYLIGIRKDVIITNYIYVFNKKPSKRFMIDFYYNFLLTFFELLFMFAKDKEYLKKLYNKIDDNTLKKVRESNSPLLITMHFSNWEATGSYFGLNIFDRIFPAFKKQSNRYAENLLNKIREKFNLYPVYSTDVVKKTVKNPNDIFAFLIDQNLRQGNYYKFLGRDTLITDVPIKLAIKQKRDIVYGYYIRDQKDSWVLKKISLEKDDNINNIMSIILDEFSSIILQKPYLWYGWWHKLWKTTPQNGGIYDKKK